MRIPVRGYNIESRLLNAIVYLEDYMERNKDMFERYYSKKGRRYAPKKPTTITLLEELKKIQDGK